MKANESTNSLIYSIDQGKTWITTTFLPSEYKIHVRKLIASPDQFSTSFIIEAYHNSTPVIIAGNISDIYNTQCNEQKQQLIIIIGEGLDRPGSYDSDYEYFDPITYQNKCFLGRKIKYIRRKAGTKCFTAYPVNTIITNCNCTLDDYEW